MNRFWNPSDSAPNDEIIFLLKKIYNKSTPQTENRSLTYMKQFVHCKGKNHLTRTLFFEKTMHFGIIAFSVLFLFCRPKESTAACESACFAKAALYFGMLQNAGVPHGIENILSTKFQDRCIDHCWDREAGRFPSEFRKRPRHNSDGSRK
ncbi:MAG TPA: hypothetical protein PKA14_10355 [Leptospiraceae bacterium]|nr:hypothetical protein [Leptospiraceae bacterium]